VARVRVRNRLTGSDELWQELKALGQRRAPRELLLQRLTADELLGAEDRSVLPPGQLEHRDDPGMVETGSQAGLADETSLGGSGDLTPPRRRGAFRFLALARCRQFLERHLASDELVEGPHHH